MPPSGITHAPSLAGLSLIRNREPAAPEARDRRVPTGMFKMIFGGGNDSDDDMEPNHLEGTTPPPAADDSGDDAVKTGPKRGSRRTIGASDAESSDEEDDYDAVKGNGGPRSAVSDSDVMSDDEPPGAGRFAGQMDRRRRKEESGSEESGSEESGSEESVAGEESGSEPDEPVTDANVALSRADEVREENEMKKAAMEAEVTAHEQKVAKPKDDLNKAATARAEAVAKLKKMSEELTNARSKTPVGMNYVNALAELKEAEAELKSAKSRKAQELDMGNIDLAALQKRVKDAGDWKVAAYAKVKEDVARIKEGMPDTNETFTDLEALVVTVKANETRLKAIYDAEVEGLAERSSELKTLIKQMEMDAKAANEDAKRKNKETAVANKERKDHEKDQENANKQQELKRKREEVKDKQYEALHASKNTEQRIEECFSFECQMHLLREEIYSMGNQADELVKRLQGLKVESDIDVSPGSTKPCEMDQEELAWMIVLRDFAKDTQNRLHAIIEDSERDGNKVQWLRAKHLKRLNEECEDTEQGVETDDEEDDDDHGLSAKRKKDLLREIEEDDQAFEEERRERQKKRERRGKEGPDPNQVDMSSEELKQAAEYVRARYRPSADIPKKDAPEKPAVGEGDEDGLLAGASKANKIKLYKALLANQEELGKVQLKRLAERNRRIQRDKELKKHSQQQKKSATDPPQEVPAEPDEPAKPAKAAKPNKKITPQPNP